MWTTKEWYACLERTAAYEYRERKRSGVGSKKSHVPMSRKQEGDAENSGLEQWLQRTATRLERTARQTWFWNNHD